MMVQQRPQQALGSRIDNVDATGPEVRKDHGKTQRPQLEGKRSQPVSAELANNMQTVRVFLNLAFNERRPHEAAARYLDGAYRQLDPAAQGTASFVRLADGYLKCYPELHLTIQLVLADGDWVVVQSLIQNHPNDRGLQVMDTFQLTNGRIVEHWDVMCELPENIAVTSSVA
jgi:predicted SnoaL-like aldol condensation-catalyzing enzyme